MVLEDMLPTKKILLLAFITALLQGCAILAYSPFSRPIGAKDTPGGNAGGFLYVRMGTQNTILLQSPELGLVIRSGGFEYIPVASGPLLPIIPWPTLFSAPDENPPPVVAIEIQVRPTVDMVFDPMRVILRAPGGQNLTPTSYIGGIPISDHSGFWFYNQKIASKAADKLPLYHTQWTCFVLQFDMTNSRSWVFDLAVEGFENNNQPLTATEVHFEKGTAWFIVWGGRESFCEKQWFQE